MKTTFFTFLFLCFATMAFSQDFQEQFEASFNTNDTAEQREILEMWKQENPKDPALFKCYFKYYVFKSQKKVAVIHKNKKKPGHHSGDEDDVSPESRKRSMFDEEYVFEPNDANMALGIMSQGIDLHPTRLDMRWEKVNVLLLMKDWEKYADELVSIIEYSKEIDNQWTWTNDKPVEDGENNFLNSIHNFATKIYKLENIDLMPQMRKISEKVIELYPNHIDSYTYVAIAYYHEQNYNASVKTMLKANEVKPKDAAILNNIAFIYETKGDKEKAIKYYQQVIKYGNSSEVSVAKKAISKLQH